MEQTEGASPAFLRELVRKAGRFAAVAGEDTVSERYFDEALSELEQGGRLTRSILGVGTDGAPAPPLPTGFPELRSP